MFGIFFSGLSDKYDPFISAKRQLEDIFSSNTMTTSTIKDSKSITNMSSSLKAKSPSSSTGNQQNFPKSNFRRVSSLRIPKKSSPSSFLPKYRPTIQRGISDEGPISSNFIKPEEYDELPVKSNAVIPPDLVPKSPNRDLSLSPIIIKRQNSTNRKEVSSDFHDNVEFQLMKTDSLAAFLKFENDLAESNKERAIERDLKEKSNIFNKVNDSNESNDPLKAIDTSYTNLFKLAPIEKSLITQKIVLEKVNFNSKCNNNNNNNTVDNNHNSVDSNIISDNSRVNQDLQLPNEISGFFESSNCVDNKATNAFLHKNHLVTNVESLSNTCFAFAGTNDLQENLESIINIKNITDIDKRNPKRQLKFRKNSLLFDSENIDKTLEDDFNETSAEQNEITQKLPRNNRNLIDTKLSLQQNEKFEELFNDFDLEEFISTFSDNEQFPIFKNYKNMMSSNLGIDLNQQYMEIGNKIETPIRPNAIDYDGYFSDNVNEIDNIQQPYHSEVLKKPDVTAEAEKRLQIESKLINLEQINLNSGKKSTQLKNSLINSTEMTQAECELLASVQELNNMCDDSKRLDLTSAVPIRKDKISSDVGTANQRFFFQKQY